MAQKSVTAVKRVMDQDPTCQGSFGDPVIQVTFGAGTAAFGPASPYSSMGYETQCPDDNYYTIVSHIDANNGGVNCHPGSWFDIPHDHTGDPNGYMMLINASYDPSIFFTQSTGLALCQKTTYEFSAYVLNMLTPQGAAGAIQPKLKFTIETPDGQSLTPPLIKTIDPTSTAEWVKCSLVFTTPGDIDQVVLKIENEAPGGNGNDLVLDDIEFRACGPVIKAGFNGTANNQPQPLCYGQGGTFNLKTEVGTGYNDLRTQWQKSDGNGGWVDMANETSQSLTVNIDANTPAGTYQYRLAAAEGDNINSLKCRTYSTPLSIVVNALPVLQDVTPASVCVGQPFTLTAVSDAINYEWSGPAVTQANKNQNPLVISAAKLSDAGAYAVIATSAAGCTTTKQTSVGVGSMQITNNNIQPINICRGASTGLNVGVTGGSSYSWLPVTGLSDPTSATPTASPADTTLYTLTATNTYGCIDSTKVKVNVLPPPVANAGIPHPIFEGQSIKLKGTAKNADTYYWTPTTALDDPQSLTPTANPTDDIAYTLHVSSNYNCGTDESSVFVRVFKTVKVPNSFSPNGDGLNDFWDIEALVTYPESIVQVFNRNGQQVYKSTGYATPWKGTYNGAALPAGTYYYVIDLKNGTQKLRGWLLIIR